MSVKNLAKKRCKISPGTLETIKLLLNTEISRLNTIKIDNTIFNEIDKIVKKFVEAHLENNSNP